MDTTTLNQRVLLAQKDLKERNLLIEEYKPFIASATQSSTGKFLRYGEDDELSIALMAFNEAITAYNIQKGSFLALARGVISKRLSDYYRSQRQERHIDISIDDDENEEMAVKPLEIIATRAYSQQQQRLDVKGEIAQFAGELGEWGITMADLVKSSPTHKSVREDARRIIRFLLGSKSAREYVEKNRMFPMALLEKELKISRKRLDRLRKYLVAMYIVATGDYYSIQGYLGL